MAETIKVLVVDDTLVYRRIVSDVVKSLDDAELVGTASNGVTALQRVKTRKPDLVLLDIVMPRMNGLETLKHITKDFPDVGVVMVSSHNREDADVTVKALKMGALDFVPKPVEGSLQENIEYLRSKIRPIMSMFKTRKYTRKVHSLHAASGSAVDKAPEVESKDKSAVLPASYKTGPIDFVAIGVSTGGPKTLMEFLANLEIHPGVRIMIVQHMPPIFTASLADHLSRVSPYMVKEAEHGEIIESGKIYLAPGGKHMVMQKKGEDYTVAINTDTPVNSCRPSVDVLFESIAQHTSGNCLAMILTGMGHDGLDGVRCLKEKGAYCITQDEESCVVYGMPKAVVEAGLSDETVSASTLAVRLNSILKR